MDYRANDFKEQIARYQEELLRLQQASHSAEPKDSENDGHFHGNVSQEQNTLVTPIVPIKAPDTAPLQVRVTAAGEAIPIDGALVVISSQNSGELTPEHTRITNNSGLTEPVLLPAIDPSLTQNPDTPFIPIVYTVAVSAPGFYSTRTTDIPLYGGIPTTLPVLLIPLPEFADGSPAQPDFVIPPISL